MININEEKKVPIVSSWASDDLVIVPKEISNCSGIIINGKKIKSLIFTTDVAIIMNNNADAIFAVYPFTLTLQFFSHNKCGPGTCFAGVGGGTTKGERAREMALLAESQGCMAVVLNAPAPIETFKAISKSVICPIVATIVSEYTDIEEKLKAGASILNISGGANTVNIVKKVREKYPEIPIIATGGPTAETILSTIEAGANAISYTPPTNGDLFRIKMDKYRESEKASCLEKKD